MLRKKKSNNQVCNIPNTQYNTQYFIPNTQY